MVCNLFLVVKLEVIFYRFLVDFCRTLPFESITPIVVPFICSKAICVALSFAPAI